MVPGLKLFIAVVCALFFFQSAIGLAQSSGKARPVEASELDDDEARDLLAGGKSGFLIERTRSEILSLLSESNSCTDWFLSAEPSAQAKFRSLHFALDLAGAAEIVRVDRDSTRSDYYHPYVAATRQNVGPGSTITINANGAFFRTSAYVRVRVRSAESISASSYRLLSVGTYAGGSPEAQLLTMLHEFGHILDLLPVDAAVPSAPYISVQNTETVLRHCSSQIRAHAKHLRLEENSSKTLLTGFVPAASRPSPNLQAALQKRSFRELSYRNDGW